jgi:hypothetical protein
VKNNRKLRVISLIAESKKNSEYLKAKLKSLMFIIARNSGGIRIYKVA